MNLSKAKHRRQNSAGSLWLLFLAAGLGVCQAQAAKQDALRQQGEDAVRESDLRAFCPPVEFSDSGYAYTLYARGSVSYQAAISDITRDCRYDRDKGLIHLQVAAAGRVVVGTGALRGTLSLPIQVKIARGDRLLFGKNYSQKVTLGQTRAATQFLFSENISVKLAEAVKGTKIFIGFAPALPPKQAAKPAGGQAGAPRGQALKPKKPAADRLSPKAGEITIPESF